MSLNRQYDNLRNVNGRGKKWASTEESTPKNLIVADTLAGRSSALPVTLRHREITN